MSNFDFKKLRQQIEQTADYLSNKFKGTDTWILRNEKISIARQGIVFTEEHRLNISKKGLGRVPPNKGKLTPESVKEKQKLAHAGAQAPNKQPILTPSGAFPSVTEAGKWAQAHGIKNAYKKIQTYIYDNIDSESFRYISDEEFAAIKVFPWQDKNHIPNWFPKKTRFRPVKSSDGVFETLDDLIKWYKSQGLTNAKKKIAVWVKQGTVTYISKQEFYNLKK